MHEQVDFVPLAELGKRSRDGQESVMGEIDRPEDILLEDLENGLRRQNAPETLFGFVRKAFRGVTERGGITAAISAYIEHEGNEIRRDTVRTVIATIIETGDARFSADVLALSSGVFMPGIESEIQLARKYGVSRQAVSKRATELCRKFGIRPSGFMRSEQAQEAYRQREIAKLEPVKQFLMRRQSSLIPPNILAIQIWEVYP